MVQLLDYFRTGIICSAARYQYFICPTLPKVQRFYFSHVSRPWKILCWETYVVYKVSARTSKTNPPVLLSWIKLVLNRVIDVQCSKIVCLRQTFIKASKNQIRRNFNKFGMYSKPAFFYGIEFNLEKKSENCSFSDFWTNSAILTGNAFYKSHLHEFLTPAVGSNPRWVLCYRASTHGWAGTTFHSRCDGKRDTVSIIKSGQYVFGGYTDIPWGK